MENKSKPQLIFVYNADSGLKNALLDSAHKILSPKTYQCKLCELTYGVFKEKKAWKEFRENSDVDMKFLHADEFIKLYNSKFRPNFELPVILLENQYDLEVLISSEKFNSINSLEGLIKQIKRILKTL
ncbi:GTPase [Flavobacterium sp. CS20]|jgi:hypothetical protein|uniref:GTPase n=1 Tax=Flavobacterium sp. CS20 TaxID=2775246 RepID=UPI001B3A5FB4|nr:GTPase [Flavobacterium sp. CS20]QTY26212.1 GTPase [Flavobacterium sp. CS20]